MPSMFGEAESHAPSRNFRYLAGAALCALVNNVVLIGVDALQWPLISGVLLSWLLGGGTGFVWHSRLTYNMALSFAAFLRFMAGALLGIPLAWAMLWLCTSPFGWPMWLAGPVSTVILFCYHYINAFMAIRWHKAAALLRAWMG